MDNSKVPIAKAMGGDEFCVTFTAGNNTKNSNGHFTAAAVIQDRQDGTYELTFHASPMNYPRSAAVLVEWAMMTPVSDS